ncbi:MAG TPA: Cys-tRNA(Pro) deacylase [Spirochaetaceae bacterium]|jgi:Cys-tRNA(Pro)/Cys-tRNA(Cys) deacylase|nr:Cys-tRNA(Pro) deacylase [Spirochaetaceae bacterium]
MTTNALRLVKALGLSVKTVEYAVDENDLSAQAVAAKLGMDIDRIFKTLVIVGDKSGAFMCVIPGSAELDLKKAAKASGNKAVSLLPLKELESLTGYVRGGCSPVGSKKRLLVYLDETAQLWDWISVSAGARGLQMLLVPSDLIKASGASYADLI